MTACNAPAEESYELLTWHEAEDLVGHRLDRRRRYFLIKNLSPGRDWIATAGKATVRCSGCTCGAEYGCSCCGDRGAGCEEYGYTGKRVVHFPQPLERVKSGDNGG